MVMNPQCSRYRNRLRDRTLITFSQIRINQWTSSTTTTITTIPDNYLNSVSTTLYMVPLLHNIITLLYWVT